MKSSMIGINLDSVSLSMSGCERVSLTHSCFQTYTHIRYAPSPQGLGEDIFFSN